TTLNANITVEAQTTQVELTGVVGVTGGAAPMPALIGDGAKLAVSAKVQGEDITIERAQLDGKTLRVSADGSVEHRIVDLNWKMALSDLAAVASTFSGRMEAQGRVQGVQGNLNLVADATGEVGTERFPRGPIKASARLQGLPGAPAGRVDARGSFDGSPLELALALQRGRDGSLLAAIERADWKSAHAEGNVALRAGDRLPQGRVAVRIARLADLQPWIGQEMQGSVVADVDLVDSSGHAQAKIQLDVRNARVEEIEIEHLHIAGRVDNPTTHPNMALQFAADG